MHMQYYSLICFTIEIWTEICLFSTGEQHYPSEKHWIGSDAVHVVNNHYVMRSCDV